MKDQLPISLQEWREPAKDKRQKGKEDAAPRPDVTFVDKNQKDLLWDTLMEHFTLPDHFTEADMQKVKDTALRKMAVAFKNHKNREWDKYVKGGRKTPVFEGTLENQSAHWDDFVKFKDSELSKERSRINKANAAKKDKFHKLGPGGYAVGMPKWDKSEKEMLDACVTPETLSWPPRCRTWFYAHGGELDPKTGNVSRKACLNGADDALLVAIEEARSGVFQPNRENDELTRALGNPEHPGRT